MAKLIMPLLSQDARGSVSGIQFSRNRGGCFGSRKSTSNRNQSNAALLHRSRLKLAHSAWLSLSSSLKSVWDSFATPPLTGRNAFIGATLRNLTIGQAAPTQSPLIPLGFTPITNLTYDYFRVPDHWYALNWDLNFDFNTVLIGYAHSPPSWGMPHVRKFLFGEWAWNWAEWLDMPEPKCQDIYALRLIHWDPRNGRTIKEWRATLDLHLPYSFED